MLNKQERHMLFKYCKKINNKKNQPKNRLLTADRMPEVSQLDRPNFELESTDGRIDTQILKRSIQHKLKNYNK